MGEFTLSDQDLAKIQASIPSLSPKEKTRILTLLQSYQSNKTKKLGKDSFLDFICHVYPGYKIGPHHRKLAGIFEDVEAGRKRRVIVNIAPRFGKSEMISYLAPAWFLGRNPQKKIIMSSHTADLAISFGRRVRNLVGSDVYHEIFPNVELQPDSKSASRWGTNFNGEYFAIGVGGALAGRGADLFIIDDAHSEQDAKTGNPAVFAPVWEWFQSGPIQRLMPGGSIIVVMCMTGDTPVMLANGTETRLDQIRVGDQVATYDDGKLITSKVLNHQSSGYDPCFEITMTSGKVLRANEKHPFLINDDGELKWVETQYLKSTQRIVCVKDNGVSGKAKPVSMKAAQNPSKSKDTANHITIKSDGHLDIEGSLTPLRNDVVRVLKTVTESLKKSLIGFLKIKMVFAQYVSNLLQKIIPALIGTTNSALTTVMSRIRSGGYSVMTAILPWGMQKPQIPPMLYGDISDFTTEEIISVIPCGIEEVFDIEVEKTGNFIANGFVSHNTRWSKLDLTGMIIDHMVKNQGSDEWEIIEFPAVFEKDDKLVSLWPEFWSIEELLAKRDSMDAQYWSSQYLQNPTSREGALIKRDWWRIWEGNNPPECEYKIMSLDSAQEKHNLADYNALQIWGVFFNPEVNNYNIILLNAIKERMEFPELKKFVLREYKDWAPDSFIVEKKSSGSALYQEFRSMGIPVSEFTPSKGSDKIARVNSVVDLFSSGVVWAPDLRWAHEVMLECQDFPHGSHDDHVDSMTLALMRFRRGGFIRVDSDEKEPIQYFKSKSRTPYY